ncbi:PPOX class F420-dependent oxidoreductase [Kribbella jiaozuonensis]|uniref:PPOX class F420-dependent oxidoreductase n=1 Tax=Kribbella jiaozuonensis TaxID=2575441 RepID=A0A4U3M347_9ACTN|nr:PPOX class F420-dependent oxidoreductase [Kribbella jiaozuonensis]TKK79108.1 PPOX class F420-dependent oxidoreductase [Kribbella jiaozuonensis]TKK83178.1 PPOX class F420-dependent oxidoreductase [Kribbella jiaozuonensis]
MLDPTIRRVLAGPAFAHLATTLPDGSPHSTPVYAGTRGNHIVFFTGPGMQKARNLRRDPRLALSIVPADNPFEPIAIRGRAVEWIEGDEAWAIIDQLVAKYIDIKYPPDHERVVIVVEPDHQTVGMS